MIKGLKLKFVCLCTLCAFVLLFVVLLSTNIMYYHTIVAEADEILNYIAKNEGQFPTSGESSLPPEEEQPPELPDSEERPRPPHAMSPELAHQVRYFSVIIEDGGEVGQVDVRRIAAIDSDEAVDYALLAHSRKTAEGFIDNYRYLAFNEDGGIRYIFLDWEMQINAAFISIIIGIVVGAVGLLLVALAATIVSGRILRPIYESYEKQRTFIADAGHELKTPITIISANVELLEMEFGKSESLDDIRSQTQRLTEMTRDLILLTRMERQEELPLIEFPLSEVVSEAVGEFRSRIAADGIELVEEISPLLSIKGDAKSITQLVRVLIDNAIKYTKGGILVRLEQQGRGVMLTVENDISEPVDQRTLERLLDRFYRADSSRNSSVGGYGIGLSIAKAIVQRHGGRIFAECPSPQLFRISVVF